MTALLRPRDDIPVAVCRRGGVGVFTQMALLTRR